MDAAKISGNFPTYLGRVVSRKESFEIVKEGIPCAYLVPADEFRCNSHEFADDIASAELPAEDRHAIGSRISRARKALRPITNPWD